jgi:tagatose-1,6-bisphosphate aldolase
MATKRAVNLSLTSDHYEAVRELLAKLPGKPSVSGLVDEMLRDFAVHVGPHLERLASVSAVDRVQAVKQIHADMIGTVSVHYVDTVRTLQQEGEKAE